ncbi:MAG: hypothetical protein Q8S09_00185, partial [Hyphomonas sp.]|nr:hypothetical protein [Hyphomonas sp.]
QMELTQCFGPAVQRPNFYSGSLDQFETDAEIQDTASIRGPTLTSLSPIGFSADDKHALVYIEESWGGRRGKGSLILLRKKDGHWKEFGGASMWIS